MRSRKHLLFGTIAVLASVWIFLLFILVTPKERITVPANLTASTALALKEAEQKTVTITFAGDIMMDRGVKSSVQKNFNGDYAALFANAKIFSQDDISFANLEGPVSDKGRNVGSIYSFRMDPKILPILKNASFEILSVANNHAGDYTILAFEDTLRRLVENGIAFTGGGFNYNEAVKPTVIEKNGIRIGFLAFTDVGPDWLEARIDAPGILLAKDKNFEDIVAKAKAECDFLIVSMHWGDEYVKFNTRQELLARRAIDSGANIIVGHHPHVEQALGFYKEKPIIYSLGNLMFDQYFSPETLRGLVVQIEVAEDARIKTLRLFESRQNKLFQIQEIVER